LFQWHQSLQVSHEFFLLFHHLLIRPCPVFYPVCLSFCNVDVQISCLKDVSYFSRFSQADYHPSHSHLLSSDSGPAYEVLILQMLPILFYRVLPVIHFKLLISVVLGSFIWHSCFRSCFSVSVRKSHTSSFFFFFFFIFSKPDLVFYPTYLFSYNADDQFWYQHFGDRPNGLGVSGFSFFCNFCKPVIIHPIYMVPSCSFSYSSQTYGIMNLVSSLLIVLRRMLPNAC